MTPGLELLSGYFLDKFLDKKTVASSICPIDWRQMQYTTVYKGTWIAPKEIAIEGSRPESRYYKLTASQRVA